VCGGGGSSRSKNGWRALVGIHKTSTGSNPHMESISQFLAPHCFYATLGNCKIL
jgi:hypothetical protein